MSDENESQPERLSRRDEFLLESKKEGAFKGSVNTEDVQLISEKSPEGERAPAQTRRNLWKGLMPDKFNMYNICMPWYKKGITVQEVQETFGLFGDIGDINMTSRCIYVRYTSKESAERVLDSLGEEYNISIPPIQTTTLARSRSQSAPKRPELSTKSAYIGNIPHHLKEKELENLVKGLNALTLKVHSEGDKRFAFATFASSQICGNAIRELNGHKLSGRYLVSRPVRDQSQHRILSSGGEDHNSRSNSQYPGIGRGLRNRSKSASHDRRPGGEGFNMHRSSQYPGMGRGFRNKPKSVTRDIQAGRGRGCSNEHYPGYRGQQGRPQTCMGHGHHRGGDRGPLPMSKLQSATDLVYRIDGLIDEVLDDCYFCGRIKALIGELQIVMNNIREDAANQQYNQQL